MRGFTLIEILIVIGLIAVLAGFGLVIGIDAYERSAFRSQQAILVSTLQTARSRALANIGECDHGITLTSSTYAVVGYGDAERCPDQEPMPLEGGVMIDGPDEIVFYQVSANVDTDAEEETITLTDQAGNEAHIFIGQNGSISWD